MSSLLKSNLQKILFLIVIGCFTYIPSFWNQFLWDDEQFIYKNQYVLTANISKIFTTNTIAGAGHQSDYYRPLTTFSFAIDHAIWGLRPFGFHLTNTCLHVMAGVVLFLLLKELFQTNQKQNHPIPWYKHWPFLLALLFLIHPIQTEAVVYINSRGDSLFTLFSFSSLYCLAFSFRKKIIQVKLYNLSLQLHKVLLLLIASFLYFLSILSKEIGIMTIGLHFLVACVFAFRNYSQNLIKEPSFFKFIKTNINTPYWHLIIFFLTQVIIAGSYLYSRATFLNFQHSFNLHGTENEYTSSVLVRMLTFSKVLWTYFRLLFVPYPLFAERTSQIITTTFNPYTIGLFLIFFLLCFFAYFEWKKTHSLWILFGMGWFFGGLIPVSGIIPINGLLYEHWLYVPMIGFYITLFSLCRIFFSTQFFQKISSLSFSQTLNKTSLMQSFWIALFSFFIILTIRQNLIWRSPISLYTYLLKHTDSARIHNNLGMAYAQIGDFDQAIIEYQAAIEKADAYPQTHHNLGHVFFQLGNFEQAEQEYIKAIEMNPNFYISHPPLIKIYLMQNKYQQLLPLVDDMLQLYPNKVEFVLLKGDALYKLEQVLEAEKYFDKALSLSNNHPKIKNAIEQIKTDKAKAKVSD